MTKENSSSRQRGYAAALQRKQATAAAASNNSNAPRLPRVAALAAMRSSQSRSPLRSFGCLNVLDRPLSSLKNVSLPTSRPGSASMHRMGCKPATHSTRMLVPLLDAHAARPAASTAPAATLVPAPVTSETPAPSASATPALSVLSGVISDLGLDGEEQALQAELTLFDQRLERLYVQHSQRRAATPMSGASAATSALSATVSAEPTSPQPSEQEATPQHRQAQQQQQGLPEACQQDRLLEREQEWEQLLQEGEVAAPTIPPSELSIVRSVTTATGTGCKNILAPHASAAPLTGACWTSRGHRVLLLESSCILQLGGRSTSNITLRITFTDAASVPHIVRLEHAPSATASFERLGDIPLQPKSLHQLRHLFRLGTNLEVRRFLRITLLGHMAEDNSGVHRVSHMLLTSDLGPQRAQSVQSGGCPVSSAAVPASIERTVDSKPREQEPPITATNAAPAAASEPAQPAGRSEPRVPPLQLAAMLGGTAAQHAVQGTVLPADATSPDALPVPASDEPAPQAAVSEQGQLVTSETAPAALSIERSFSSYVSAAEEQQPTPSHSACTLGWKGLADGQVQGTVWSQLEALEAPLDYQQLESELAAGMDKSLPRISGTAAAAPMMLLPMQRCHDVGAFLAELNLTPQQAREAALRLFDREAYSTAAGLTEPQVEQLRACLPSAEERQLLSSYCGRPQGLGSAEQFMLEMMQVPALEEGLDALRFSSHFAGRAQAVQSAAALLTAACQEVRQSDLLQTLLKVALLAGNFLNAGNHNGIAAGFQIDALLKLRDVRSTRARSRTLLHFVAREASRQHPDGACLRESLPSAEAAARSDLQQARAELRVLAAGIRHVEGLIAAAQDGVTSVESVGACLAYMTAFRAEALDRLSDVQAKMDKAESAFRHLGSFINGQRSTLGQPAAFFGVLHAFAAELDAAHKENASADASVGMSAEQQEGKSKQQRQSSEALSTSTMAGSPTTSAASVELLHHRRGSTARQESSSLQVEARQEQAFKASTIPTQHRQHSPSPCLSKAAIAGIGGSRRLMELEGRAEEGQNRCAGSQHEAGAEEMPASIRLSTPVTSLLAESARLIGSVEGGFGSTLASDAAGTFSIGGGEVAATPKPAAGEAEETNATYSTPREAVPLHWQDQQPEAGPAAAASQQWQTRYAAATSSEQEVHAGMAAAAGAMAAAVAEAGSVFARSSGKLGLGQLRQCSLQHLSPTSTPLSSLGLQSSRGSGYSSGGSTPGSSMRFRGAFLRNSSPLGARGMGATVLKAEAAVVAAFTGRGAVVAPGTDPLSSLDGLLMAVPAELPGAAAPPHPSVGGEAAHFGELEQQLEEQQLWRPVLPQQEASETEYVTEEEDDDAPHLQARGIVPLHSRAGSFDLTFYAPFSASQGAFADSGQQAQLQLSASFACSDLPAAAAWGPLAAQQQQRLQQRASHAQLYSSADDLALLNRSVASVAGGGKRVSFSVPSSPRRSLDVGGSRLAPLNRGGLAGRLQPHQQPPQLSPVLEALLGSVSTPSVASQAGRASTDAALAAGGHPRLDNDDLVDLADYSSDHEAEWQALEAIQQQDAERKRQQLAVQEQREVALLQQPLEYQPPEPRLAAWASQEQLFISQGELVELQAKYLAAEEAQQAQSPQQQWQELEEPQEQEQRGEQQGQWEEMEQCPAGQAQLPSPITSATSDLDVAVTKLLACVGNTTAGPLELGTQGGAFGGVAEMGSSVALLEPIMPGPMAEGIRASRGMAQQVPAAVLRQSLEGQRALLRGTLSAPAATLIAEAEVWASEHPVAPGQQQQQAEGLNAGNGSWVPQHRNGPLAGLKKMLGKLY